MDSIGDVSIIDENMFAFFENADYFHIYNLKEDTIQTIDYIGFFAGVVYQSVYRKLHVAVHEGTSGILTYSPIRSYTNSLDNLIF